MKSPGKSPSRGRFESHPARGAWIEITGSRKAIRMSPSHPARGAWIEILMANKKCRGDCRRTPHGVRGLKSCLAYLKR